MSSSTVIRNLINNSIDKPLASAKSEIKKEGRKQVTKIQEKLPLPEDLQNQFITNACSLKSQEKIFKSYQSKEKLLKKFLNKLEKAKEKLSNNENKLSKIQQIIDTIGTILAVIAGIILILEIVVRAAPAGLAASSGPAASGIVIKTLSDAIDYGKAKIKEYGSLTKAISAALPKYLDKAFRILAIIGTAILAINTIIMLIKKLLTFLEFLYAKYVENCTIADQTPINNDGTLNEDLILEGNNLIDEMSLY
jgi:ABC-type multidrug transport system fused ATPase/permease subunit